MPARELRVPPHAHCRICGKPIPVNREFCSPACASRAKEAEESTKRTSRFFVLLLIVTVVFIILMNVTR